MASQALEIDPKKSDTNQPDESRGWNVSETVNNENVAALAYLLWHERGCPTGSDQDDWFRAEHELQSHRTGSTEQPHSERGLSVVRNADTTNTSETETQSEPSTHYLPAQY